MMQKRHAENRGRGADPLERLLRTSADLFRRYGYRAVGVDTIVEEADVAKMTLYRNFASKDDLIAAFLEREDVRTRAWLRRVTADAGDPRAKIRSFFEALGERTADDACLGCPFQMAASEFPDPDHPVHRLARRHKQALQEELIGWVRAVGLIHVEHVANQLFLLMEGAWVSARMRFESRPPDTLAAAAVMIVEGSLFAQAVPVGSSGASTNSD